MAIAHQMEAPAFDMTHLLIPAAAAVLGALLTYLATRRQHQVSERRVYVGAVEQLTADLRAEIARVNADREGLRLQLAALERQAGAARHAAYAWRQRAAALEARCLDLQQRITAKGAGDVPPLPPAPH